MELFTSQQTLWQFCGAFTRVCRNPDKRLEQIVVLEQHASGNRGERFSNRFTDSVIGLKADGQAKKLTLGVTPTVQEQWEMNDA
jgi:hypothetical protein